MRDNLDERTRPPGQPDWLRVEVGKWVAERLLRPEQARMILARYGLVEGGENPRSLRQTQIVYLVSAVGAILMGIGVLVLVGANWEAIPRVARLAILVLGALGFHAAGYWLGYERKSYPGVGKALILIGSIVWLSSIFLVAQMFHLGGSDDPEYAKGLLYGFLGLLPLAYALRSPLQMALALFVGTAWVFLGWPSGPFWEFGFAWIPLKLLAVATLVYVAGLLHRPMEAEETLAPTWTKFGIALASISLYILSFEHVMHAGEGTAWARLPWTAYGIVLALAVVGGAWYAWRAGQAGDRTGPYEAAACIGLAAVAAGLPFLVSHSWSDPVTEVMVLANVLLLGLEVGCIWVGWSRAQAGLINWGLALFFIHLMTRYFDLFFNMLGSGAAFIGAGLILLLAGWILERQRRRLLQTMPDAPEERAGGQAPGSLPEGGMA